MNPAEYRRMYESEDSHWWYAGLHELVLDYVREEAGRVGRRLRILDAGCGTGRLCQLMSAYGEVSGVDASTEAISYCCERGVAASCGDLNDLSFEREEFDVITSMDVLYHIGIRDDVAVLGGLRSALKPGGLLILNLVAHEFLRSTHDIAVHTRERYTLGSLGERLKSAGFETSFITYRVALLFPFIAVYRIAARFFARRNADRGDVVSDVVMPHPLVNAALLRIVRLENQIVRTVRMPMGSSVFAVARKPCAPLPESP